MSIDVAFWVVLAVIAGIYAVLRLDKGREN